MKKTTEWFIDEVLKRNNHDLDFSNFVYQNSKTKGKVKCNVCGHVWETIPGILLNNHGCPKCENEKAFSKRRLTQENVVERLHNLYGDKYDYSKVKYFNARTKIEIVCKKHGSFYATTHDLFRLHGCPRCNESRLEREVENALMEAGINFERQKTFDWTKTSATGSLSFDFFIPELNLAIECQGRQHFMPVKAFGGEKEFEKTLSRDENKVNLSKEHGINLVYFLKENHNRYMVEDRIFFNNVKNLIEYIKR